MGWNLYGTGCLPKGRRGRIEDACGGTAAAPDNFFTNDLGTTPFREHRLNRSREGGREEGREVVKRDKSKDP